MLCGVPNPPHSFSAPLHFVNNTRSFCCTVIAAEPIYRGGGQVIPTSRRVVYSGKHFLFVPASRDALIAVEACLVMFCFVLFCFVFIPITTRRGLSNLTSIGVFSDASSCNGRIALCDSLNLVRLVFCFHCSLLN